jgi:nitrogen fixation/metabolism regulation signal transduction histidine kinase
MRLPMFLSKLLITPKAAWQWLLHSRLLGRIALAMAVLGLLVAVFSLAAAAGNNRAWTQHYNTLLWLNVGMIVCLLILVLALLGRLLLRLKKARFGAQLTLKFASSFALLGILPGVLVYCVSALFLSQSIDSWFNVKVDAALDAGLELSRAAINAQLQTLTQKARTATASVNRDAGLGTEAQRIRGQFSDADVLFFEINKADKADNLSLNLNSKVLASTGSQSSKGLLTDTPTGEDLKLLTRNGVFSQIESIPNADGNSATERLNLRAVVQLPKTADSTEPSALHTYLQLSQAVSPQIAQWAQTVAQGSKDYESLAIGRTGLRKIYGATLTITMLLAVLAAVATGFVLADTMTAPLLRLARGTQAVAGGDFSLLREPTGKDDLAVLTRSFNLMLNELGTARGALTQSNSYLAQVLTSLSTGVLVLDAQQALRSINPSAQTILGMSASALNAPAALQLPEAVWQAITDKSTQSHWQTQLEIARPSGEVQTLLLRGAHLAQADGDGVLLVFDDVSEVMLAQKAQAWSEVARRLAHEIKNPLTPIQLSAERLMAKLADKLTGTDAELLKRSTGTIVTQVTALKNMVDEFRQYARLPQAQLEPLRLNALVNEVLALYSNSTSKIAVQLNAERDNILADADQLRQVLHNLLGNAIDAAMQNETRTGAALVTVTSQASPQGLLLRISDNGMGFSTESLAKVFEPYHTTKAQGTGLGLAIVHRIVQDHRAMIRVKNKMSESDTTTTGAQVDIVFPYDSIDGHDAAQARLV